MRRRPAHDTIAISQTIEAPPEQVFAAWKDPQARALWGPPSDDEAIAFVETDFRVGGRDVHRCGPRHDLRFEVETHYHDISAPHRLLFTERVSTEGALLSVSLVTVTIDGNAEVSELDVTIQIASMVGTDMIDGTRGGWERALAQLGQYAAKQRLGAD